METRGHHDTAALRGQGPSGWLTGAVDVSSGERKAQHWGGGGGSVRSCHRPLRQQRGWTLKNNGGGSARGAELGAGLTAIHVPGCPHPNATMLPLTCVCTHLLTGP